MKKIVRGNDLTLRIPVCKIVDGAQVAFPLPACTDVVVNLVSLSRRYPLEFYVDAAEDNVIIAKVEGEKMPTCQMALEVRGKVFGLDWRSNEYEQVQFVDNNAAADTEFEPEEGEQSVEMDTAIVILPPSADLTALIKQAEQQQSEISQAEAARVEAETNRETAEASRGATEATRTETEDARKTAEASRESAEAKRESAEQMRQVAESTREQAEAAREKAEAKREEDIKAATDAAIARAKVAVSYNATDGTIDLTTQD